MTLVIQSTDPELNNTGHSDIFIFSSEEGLNLRTSLLHTVRSVIVEADVIKRDAHIILAQVNFLGYREGKEEGRRRRRSGW